MAGGMLEVGEGGTWCGQHMLVAISLEGMDTPLLSPWICASQRAGTGSRKLIGG